MSQIIICVSFDKIHLAVHKVEQKATSQHRYWNYLIRFQNFIELCQFNGNIIKVRLYEQKETGVMYTNAHSQHIL